MPIVYPPNEVYEVQPDSKSPEAPRLPAGYITSNWVKTICPKEGGMFSVYSDEPVWRKGHADPRAVSANNELKRVLLAIVTPLASRQMLLPAIGFVLTPKKKPFLEKILFHYTRLADSIVRDSYLRPEFYNNTSKEIWKFTEKFLINIGFSEYGSNLAGKILANMFEWDDVYRLRVVDICTETNLALLLKNPRKEILRVQQIYASRELCKGANDVEGRFLAMFKLFRLILLLPKIKKAFLKTLASIDFTKLQFDDIDRYYSLSRGEYNFFGQPLIARLTQYHYIHENHNLKQQIIKLKNMTDQDVELTPEVAPEPTPEAVEPAVDEQSPAA